MTERRRFTWSPIAVTAAAAVLLAASSGVVVVVDAFSSTPSTIRPIAHTISRTAAPLLPSGRPNASFASRNGANGRLLRRGDPPATTTAVQLFGRSQPEAVVDGSSDGQQRTSKRQWLRQKASNVVRRIVNLTTAIRSRRLPSGKRMSVRHALTTAALAFSALLFSTVSSFSRSGGGETLLASSSGADGRAQANQQQAERVVNYNSRKQQRDYLQVSGGGTSTTRLSSSFSDALRRVARPKSSTSPTAPPTTTQQQQTPYQKTILAAALPKTSTKAPPAAVDAPVTRTLRDALTDLQNYMSGPKSDTLLLLLSTALITPLCQRLGTSPILGFLAAGMLLGPNGWGLISGIHTTETLAELGIVFFLFEMGIELSFERLKSMRKDVFGLGLSQFVTTALAVATVGKFYGLSPAAMVVVGGGLALSSSAFVLQLLKDKEQLATRFGKASFGVLLFQDLAVVPLLVVTPLLAGSGSGLAAALGSAVVKAAMALGSIAFAGRVLLNPLFKTVAKARSQEAFLGLVLLTVLSMSFLTEGLGLSNTLGAFLAGVLLSETKYRYQVEADIAPFRGILLGLFFVTVGFEIDVFLIARNLPLVSTIVLGILALKATIVTLLSLAFGLSLSTSQQTGLILSQGGEFAFVAFGLARSLGILDKPTTKLLLTCASLTMALTPLLAEVGGKIAKHLEEESDFTHYLGQDPDAEEIKADKSFVVVVGYGVVGKVVTDLLNRKFIKYVGLEVDPSKAIEARNKGLPVFYGDIARPEVAEAFGVDKAKAIIVTISDKAEANRALIALRRLYPDKKIFARAADADHASRLQKTLDVVAMVPILPEDNVLLTLPFGGAVLKSLGAPAEEVNAILEAKRKEVMLGRDGNANEEETVLAQLGISADEPAETEKEKKPKAAASAITETQMKGLEVIDAEVEAPALAPSPPPLETTASKAEHVLEELKEKNPMSNVAQAIEAIAPESLAEAAKEAAAEAEAESEESEEVETVPQPQ